MTNKLIRIDPEWVIDDPRGFLEVLLNLLTVDEIYRICSFDEAGINDSLSLAKYLPAHKTIAINKTLIQDTNTFIAVFIHEVRHLYQHHCIEHPEDFIPVEGKESIEQWGYDFLNYVPYSQDPDKNMKQFVEVDAQAFTKVMLIRLFGIGNYQPSCYQLDSYKKWVDYLMMDFPNEDVQEVLHWELQHGTFVNKLTRTKPSEMA